MSRSRRITLLPGVAAFAVLALALSACSSAQASGPTSAPKTSGASTAAQQATVDVAQSSLGRILVDSQGRTLYLFEKDMGTQSECTGECAAAWPPLRTSGNPTGGTGVDASLIGTTPRSDGKAQVTYNGHPLYLFSADTQPGDTNGQGVDGFGALWYVVSPAGNAITGSASSSGSSSGGLGY